MGQSFRKDAICLAFLAVFCAILYGWKLGSFGLLDPDEPFYALTAKEMLTAGEFFTPTLFGQPQFEKPILFYWVELLGFKLFGVNAFAARIGPCVAGILTVIVTYLWGRALFRRRAPSFLSALVLATAIEIMVVSRIVLTDIFLCLFVAAALYCFSLGYREPPTRRFSWKLLFFFCGLGFLTKGPLGILVPFFGIISFLILSGEKELLRKIPWRWGLFIFAAVGFPWYALMTARHGVDFLSHFFLHENVRRFFFAEHRNWDNVFVYPAALILGFFPWSGFVPGSVIYAVREALRNRTSGQKNFLFLICAVFVPLCFFTMAKSKLLSYILPVFPALALILGAWMWRLRRIAPLFIKPRRVVVFLTFFFWVLFPAALVSGAVVYGQSVQQRLTETGIWLFFGFVLPCWAAFFFFLKRQLPKALSLVVAAMVFFSGIIFGKLLPEVEEAFSVQRQTQWFQKNVASGGDRLLLASRIFVRGVSYHTGSRHVGVLINDPKKVFYTNHPIPIYSTREQFLKMNASEFPIYCFLRPKELRLLGELTAPPLSVTMLDQNPGSTLVRLDRVGSQ